MLKTAKTNNCNYGSINHVDNTISSTLEIHAHLSRSQIDRKKKANSKKSPFLPAHSLSPKKSPFFRGYSPALTSKSAIPKLRPEDLVSSYSSSSAAEESSDEDEGESDDASYAEDESYEDVLEEEEDEKINVWQAGFTIINLFLGLCLLSYPYALYCGSITSLVFFIFICYALCYTGKLIVRSFDKLPPNQNHTYPAVGLYAFKNNKYGFRKFGYYLISCGIVAELFGALCTNTIFLWRNLSYLLLPIGLTLNEIILICSICSLPTCWMLNFKDLSINSFLGCVCKIFTAIVVIITFFLDLQTVHENMVNNRIDIFPTSMSKFCVSIGIYIMSFSGHPCLPSIYRAMKNPAAFEKMLDICFIIMAVSYIFISVFGYLTFSDNTNIIITGNLLNENIYLSKTLIVLVVLGCYFQVSPLIAVMAEIPENNIFKLKDENNKTHKFKIRMFRTILFLFICFISYICMDKLYLIEACTGSLCTMIVSVICPSLFYYKLFLQKSDKNAGGKRQNLLRFILYSYVIVGCIVGLYMFITDLSNAIEK